MPHDEHLEVPERRVLCQELGCLIKRLFEAIKVYLPYSLAFFAVLFQVLLPLLEETNTAEAMHTTPHTCAELTTFLLEDPQTLDDLLGETKGDVATLLQVCAISDEALHRALREAEQQTRRASSNHPPAPVMRRKAPSRTNSLERAEKEAVDIDEQAPEDDRYWAALEDLYRRLGEDPDQITEYTPPGGFIRYFDTTEIAPNPLLADLEVQQRVIAVLAADLMGEDLTSLEVLLRYLGYVKTGEFPEEVATRLQAIEFTIPTMRPSEVGQVNALDICLGRVPLALAKVQHNPFSGGTRGLGWVDIRNWDQGTGSEIVVLEDRPTLISYYRSAPERFSEGNPPTYVWEFNNVMASFVFDMGLPDSLRQTDSIAGLWMMETVWVWNPNA